MVKRKNAHVLHSRVIMATKFSIIKLVLQNLQELPFQTSNGLPMSLTKHKQTSNSKNDILVGLFKKYNTSIIHRDLVSNSVAQATEYEN